MDGSQGGDINLILTQHGVGWGQRVSFHFVDSFFNPEGYYSHFREEMGKLKLPNARDSEGKNQNLIVSI